MIVIYHNPDCGTSRNVVEMVKASGADPVIIPYLETGWTRAQLLGLFAAADITPKEALRTTKSPTMDLGLLENDVDDDAILNEMIKHPILVNRPIVCSPKGVKLCRPSEAVLDLLETPLAETFTKEDGEQIG
ncbi:arsenate reductase family protein [Hirschia baltica]|uniref:Arsenate reductase n=1 Tax=Hirschia baltica (strain ATCC 49814 / DSM 5838 / IFAM 1418) TaxID=582402 RepID=C6XL56_HIRBI|nr:arsenate reductase family protein [Hirschia baltica]ACT57885.1 arsenate reductase and related [Hirschia baltica ATCC 49814]